MSYAVQRETGYSQTHAAQHTAHNHDSHAKTRHAAKAPKLTKRSNSLNVFNYSFSKEQYMLPEDDRVIETCRSVLNVLMQILDFLSNIYIYIYMFVCACVGVCN